jgi:hypothetical protein
MAKRCVESASRENGESRMGNLKRYWIALAALALGLVSASAMAHCDFLTGGGFKLVCDSGAKANFGIGGGCKHGACWGHLEYVDTGPA